MEIFTIMVVRRTVKQVNCERYVLHDVIPPFKVGRYEEFPAGYISFPSYEDYRKIKNIDKMISTFLERRRAINKDDKVYKCLELIESLIEDCDVMRLGTNDECSFNEAFPDIIEFIEKVGYNYKDKELVDVGVLFVNEGKRVKEKYIKIVEKLYKKKIWPFEG